VEVEGEKALQCRSKADFDARTGTYEIDMAFEEYRPVSQ
jgi:hypothetical protein